MIASALMKFTLRLRKPIQMKYLFILIIFCFLMSCNEKDRIDTLINKANELVNLNSDSSAILLLQEIPEEELSIDSLKAKYWLTVARAHLSLNRSITEDSLILYSYNYYSNTHPIDTFRLLKAYNLLGNYYWWADRKKDARNTLYKGIDLATKANDTIACIHLLKSVMRIAMQDDTGENDINYIKKLITVDYRATDLYDYYEGLGILYYYKNEKDSSLYYLRKAIDNVMNIDSTQRYNYFERNYADILSDFGDNNQAINVQKRVLDYYKRTNNAFEPLSYLSLSRYYLNKGIKDSTFYYMQLAEKKRLPYIDEDLSLSNHYAVQKTLLHYIKTGTYDLRLVSKLSNNIFDRYWNRNRIIEEKNETQRLLEKRNMNLLLIKQRNLFLFILFAVFVSVTIFIMILYIQKRRKMLYEKEEELEALRKLISDSRKADNNDENFFKKMLLQQLGIIKLVAANPTSQNQEIIKQMQKIANKDIPVDSLLNWDDLYTVINNVYDNFYSKIHNICKEDLIDREYQLCCLLKAEFSTKEISVVTQQSVRTIYQRKSTIRQKLSMNEKEDIIEHLDTLILNSLGQV